MQFCFFWKGHWVVLWFLQQPQMTIDPMCLSSILLQPHRLTLRPYHTCNLTSTLGRGRSSLGMESSDFLVTCSFHPSGQILDNFPFRVIIPNCVGIRISKLNLISWFSAIFLASLFHGVLYPLLSQFWKGFQLHKFIIPPPTHITPRIKILTWFHFSTIETSLDIFSCQGMVIFHWLWMCYSGLLLAHVTGIP